MQLRRLHPDPNPVEAATLFDDIDFAALAPAQRPYVVVNMVASADGRAALEGRTESLSSPADRAVFHALRTAVEGVLVGTGTLRAERYGRMVKSEERQRIRVARGLEAEPLSIVLSRSGEFPDDIPLFADPAARLALFSGDEAAAPHRALERVRSEHGVRSVLCEGGPRLNGALLAAGLVDELFLTITPVLAATPAPLTIVEGSAGAPAALELVWTLEAEGMLFLRYRVGGSVA